MRGRKAEISDREIARLAKLYRQGFTLEQLAYKIGTSRQRLHYLFVTRGVKCRSLASIYRAKTKARREREKSLLVAKKQKARQKRAFVLAMYGTYRRGLSLSQCAYLYGVKYASVVSSMFSSQKLKVRTRAQAGKLRKKPSFNDFLRTVPTEETEVDI